MDSGCKKVYGIHEADGRRYIELYFSPHVPYSIFKESTINMTQALYKAFSTGMVTGRTLIDLSIGPVISHLLVMKDFVQEITVLESNEPSLKEIEKWKNKDPDAFDWTHTIEFLIHLQGKSDKSEEEEEENLRGKIKNIMKWEINSYDPADSLPLPKADIATNIWGLESFSQDHEEYRRNLRKLCHLINLGGYLLSYTNINCSYYIVGEHKFHLLSCDESFYREAISEAGFEIKHCETFDRKMVTDSIDHEGIVFFVAQKVRQP